MAAKTVPCPTCPWRKSSTVGGADIPGFSLCKMQGLSNTVGHGDAFRTIMACHYSDEGEETVCVGYVAQEGWSNLSIRMMVIDGRLDMAAIADACADLDLWPDFDTMLEEYEAAHDAASTGSLGRTSRSSPAHTVPGQADEPSPKVTPLGDGLWREEKHDG